MTFDEAFKILIGHEGNFSDDPRDRGNWTSGEIGIGQLKGTKYGIASHAYPQLDIKNLTLDQAKEIYKRDFWDQCHIDDLPAETHFDIFDMAVNGGVKTSVKLIQRALGVGDDGIWGNMTSAAAAACKDGVALSKRFNGYRLRYYTELPTFATYGKGWTNRVAYNLINV